MSSKAENLRILADHGFRVPAGFVLDAEHYTAAIAPILASIKGSLPDATAIRSLIDGLELPAETNAFIERELDRMPINATFAVRSSGMVVSAGHEVGEDGHDVSLAGQFDSLLAVPRDKVVSAVKKVWSSLFNDRSIHRFEADDNYVELSSMTVVIQEFIPAKSAIVMMTVDPQGAGDTGAIECTWGACEAIVAGTVSPDELVFDRETGAIVSCRIGAKEDRIDHKVGSTASDESRRMPTSPAERDVMALDLATVHALIALGSRIETVFGCPQDIEAVTDILGDVVITQARPVTVIPPAVTPFSITTSERNAP